MEGKTEEEVERYAKVFKERYKELNGMSSNHILLSVSLSQLDLVELIIRLVS